MNSKNKYIGATIILVALVWVFVFSPNRQNESLEVPSKNLSESKQVNTIVEEKPTQYKSVVTSEEISNKKEPEKNNLAAICGFDYESNKISFKPDTSDISQLSQSQQDALASLQTDCDEWYKYFGNLSLEEQIKFKKKKEKRDIEVNKYIFPKPSKELKAAALDYLKNKVDQDTDFDRLSVNIMYLLMYDNELKAKLNERLGFSLIVDFLSDNAIPISMLYTCQYTDCSTQSFSRLRECLIDVNECGLSLPAYLQATSSVGQYIDWENTVIALQDILNSEWFLNR